MSALSVKLRRDLRHRPAPLISVVVLVLLGVGLYGASYDAYRNLDDSYQQVFEEFRVADLTVTGGDTAAIARRAAAEESVAATEVRTVAEVPLRLPDGSTLNGRIIGVPSGEQPAVNRLRLIEGHLPGSGSPAAAVAERHLAEHAGLSSGSSVEVWQDDSWQRLTVTGSTYSAEYLWPAASRQEVLPAQNSFGVLFVPEQLAGRIAGSGPSPNQVAIRYTEAGRADAASLNASLGRTARELGATEALTRAQQPSNAALQEDIQGFSTLAVLFPLLFLGAAGLAIYVVLTRRVARDRSVIGMLRANGYRSRTVLGHYLSFGLLAGTAGALPGVAAGLGGAGAVTRMYTDAIGIPVTQVSVRLSTVAVGLAFGLLAGALSALAPALAASRIPPAEAMRGVAPVAHGGRGLLARLERVIPAARQLPAGAWMVLRGPTRQPLRSLYTVLGVVLALVLVLVSWGMIDSVRASVARQFDQVLQQDAQLTLAQPADAARVERIAAVPGVAAAEPAAELPATLDTGSGPGYSTTLLALPSDTAMHRFLPPDGGSRTLPRDGVLLGAALQDELGLHTGDRVPLRLPGGAGAEVTVAGFVDEPFGANAYATLDQLRQVSAQVQPRTVLVRFDESADGTDADGMRDRLSQQSGVLAYSATAAERDSAEQFMDLLYVFLGIMLLFGGLLAFTVLFATMSVNLAERGAEVAALRACGVARRRLNALITAENLLLVAVGTVPGLILGRAAVAGFLGEFSSDLMSLHTEVRPLTYLLSAAAVLVVALLAQLPGLRALGRLDLAAAVRERAG